MAFVAGCSKGEFSELKSLGIPDKIDCGEFVSDGKEDIKNLVLMERCFTNAFESCTPAKLTFKKPSGEDVRIQTIKWIVPSDKGCELHIYSVNDNPDEKNYYDICRELKVEEVNGEKRIGPEFLGDLVKYCEGVEDYGSLTDQAKEIYGQFS